MTILLGFTVQTDHFITAIRSDVIDIDKEHCGCQIIDFTIHFTLSVVNKEVEKIKKYLDLATELKKVWNIKVTVVSLVVGVMGRLAIVLE